MTAPSVLVNELPVDDSGSESDRYVVAPAGDHLVRSWRARASVEVVVDAIVAVSSTAAVYNESAVVSYDNIVATASSDAAAFSIGSAVVASFRVTSSSGKITAQHSPAEEDDFDEYLLKAFSRAQKPRAADIDAADVILRTADSGAHSVSAVDSVVHNNITAVGEKRSFAMIAPVRAQKPRAADIDVADVILRTAVSGAHSVSAVDSDGHNNITAVGEKRSFAKIAPVPSSQDADDIAIASTAPLVPAQKVRRCHYDMAAANQTWKPRPTHTQPFSERAIQRNLPVQFALTHAAHDCKRALLEIIRRYPRRHVYVGTTVDPIRRWLGDTREDFERYRKEHPKKKLQPLHKGHGQSRYRGKAPPFTEMHVLAFAPLQKAVMLEPYLIRTAMDHCDGWCVNVAIDARGMTAEPNFLYVVINDIDCQSRLAHPDPSE